MLVAPVAIWIRDRHRADRAREGGRFLDVEALTDEDPVEAEPLTIVHFFDQVMRRARCSGQRVKTEFVHLHRASPCSINQNSSRAAACEQQRCALCDTRESFVLRLAARVTDVDLLHHHGRFPHRERFVPVDAAGVEAGDVGIAARDFRTRRKCIAGACRSRAARRRIGRLAPVSAQRAEVDQRIAERRHVPIEDRRHAIGILGLELAVVELQIVVQHADALRRRHRCFEPAVHFVEQRHVFVFCEFPARGPTLDLPLYESVRTTEVAESVCIRIDVVQIGHRIDQRVTRAFREAWMRQHGVGEAVADHHAGTPLHDDELRADHRLVGT